VLRGCQWTPQAIQQIVNLKKKKGKKNLRKLFFVSFDLDSGVNPVGTKESNLWPTWARDYSGQISFRGKVGFAAYCHFLRREQKTRRRLACLYVVSTSTPPEMTQGKRERGSVFAPHIANTDVRPILHMQICAPYCICKLHVQYCNCIL